jgi:hypothetical protein
MPNMSMGEVHQLLLKHGLEEAKRVAVANKNDRLCFEAAHAVMSDEKGSIGIAHAGFAMAALGSVRGGGGILVMVFRTG